jgi:hypothetical protein
VEVAVASDLEQLKERIRIPQTIMNAVMIFKVFIYFSPGNIF